MTKRWTTKDDQCLYGFGEELAEYVAQHDMGRPAGAGRKRWKKLRETGVLDLLEIMNTAHWGHYLAVGHPHEWDQEMLLKVEWMMRNAAAIRSAMESNTDLRCVTDVVKTVASTEPEEAGLIQAYQQAAEAIAARHRGGSKR